MKLLFQSRVSLVAVVLLFLFAPLAIALNPLSLYILTGSVLMVTSIAAVCMYWPVIHYTLRTQVSEVDKTEILTFGIILLFAGTAFREGYITFWRELFPLPMSRPEEFYYPLAFIRYTCIVASVMALCARDMVFGSSHSPQIPGWPTAILSTAAGIVIGIGMVIVTT